MLSKQKDRFLFFKYVPERKNARTVKEVVPESAAEELPAESIPEEQSELLTGLPGWPSEPDCPGEEYPDEPNCPDEDYPDVPECPEEEYPNEPSCPDEDYPDVPECPDDEYPDEPEYPEPEPEPEPEPGPCPENSTMHIVRRGDTYWKLARKYNTTVEAIEAANPGVNPLNLQIGQELCIPLGIPGAKG